MKLKERVLNALTRLMLRMTCRIDAAQMQTIPREGPALLLSNHVTNIEGPLYYVLLRPRRITALAKRELWDKPFTRLFMETWNIIPVVRGGVDSRAMRECMRALDEGYILGMAAEGTRSKTGVLRQGQPGATLLATRKNVPIYPIVHWGLLDLKTNLKRLRRTPVSIRVGRPFRLCKPGDEAITAVDRRKMVDEMMYQLAILLPAELRGDYADLSRMTTAYVQFCGDAEG
ncbi:MAG: 1-acyl-sn-glycerol-3-phosphate acyltransferase [Spirochaetaceae bacterium]|nr:MAG: 1-acyl-sn-glycerol-3-phosphate acyltransferase [Spirochaetaceae bacterium]